MWEVRQAAIPSLIGLAVIGTAAARCAHRAPAPPPPPVIDGDDGHMDCSVPDDSAMQHMTGDELALARAWRERHDCPALPECAEPDPVVELRADIDDAPGVERVIANNRFGVAIYAASGEELGVWGRTECGQPLHLAARRFDGPARRPLLVVRSGSYLRDGEVPATSVLGREPGYYLDALATIEEDGGPGCTVEIAPLAPGVLVVRYGGACHAACAVRLDAESSPEIDAASCQ